MQACNEGNIWSAIRGELSWVRDDMKHAVESQQHEVESAWFDKIARQLAKTVCDRIRREAESLVEPAP